ncbi:hypothetical protein [Haloarcula sp. CGMCC 1.2071]|uniref:hypothetical protein n=1 Tax=Haloarcula sp. CGMCC 1.2071 TaxID=3111454 RepID=UPI00300F1A2F
MTQQHETEEPESVQARIEALTNKSERVQELTDELQGIQQKRERAANKNDAFRDLERKVSETREQYERLELWSEYANRMGIGIPDDDIQARQSDVERKLQELTSNTWDNFENATAIREVIREFEGHRKAFLEFTNTVSEAVQKYVDDELDSADRTLTLLQIPDIGNEAAEQTCDYYQYFLNKLADGKPSDDVTPDKWESYHDEFHELDIDLGGGLSDDAKDVIWALLEDETVTLAEIDEAVLDDLNTFEEFSKRLSIQFTTNP